MKPSTLTLALLLLSVLCHGQKYTYEYSGEPRSDFNSAIPLENGHYLLAGIIITDSSLRDVLVEVDENWNEVSATSNSNEKEQITGAVVMQAENGTRFLISYGLLPDQTSPIEKYYSKLSMLDGMGKVLYQYGIIDPKKTIAMGQFINYLDGYYYLTVTQTDTIEGSFQTLKFNSELELVASSTPLLLGGAGAFNIVVGSCISHGRDGIYYSAQSNGEKDRYYFVDTSMNVTFKGRPSYFNSNFESADQCDLRNINGKVYRLCEYWKYTTSSINGLLIEEIAPDFKVIRKRIMLCDNHGITPDFYPTHDGNLFFYFTRTYYAPSGEHSDTLHFGELDTTLTILYDSIYVTTNEYLHRPMIAGNIVAFNGEIINLLDTTYNQHALTVVFDLGSTSSTGPEISNPNAIQLYPNPSSGKFTINYSMLSQTENLEIVNSLGQVVYSKGLEKGSSSKVVLLEGLAKGVYITRIGRVAGILIIQ